jgi:hypothetical protein
MSVVDALRSHVRDNRRGMVVDLAFAVVWVTVVTVVFDVFSGPRPIYYLTLLGGVVAYYGFFWSLAVARERQR